MKLLLFFLYLALCLRLASRPSIRGAILLAAVPWLVLVAISDFPVLLAFFLLTPAWLHLWEGMYKHHCVRRARGLAGTAERYLRPAASLALAMGMAVVIGSPGPYTGLLLAAAGGPVATAFLYFSFLLGETRRAHMPFLALPILNRFHPRRAAVPPEVSLHLVLALLVLVSYPVLRIQAGLMGSSRGEVIRLHPVGTDGVSWRSLAMLVDYGGTDSIPNLADYLAHRAYQESLIFGRAYGFPTPGERIKISEYRVDSQDLRVYRTYRVVKQFKESWLYHTLDTAPPGSVARLLADQEAAGVLEMSPAVEPAGRYGVFLMLIALFLLQLLVPRHFNLTASVLYATRSLTLRRR
jgi:hypothetical protein